MLSPEKIFLFMLVIFWSVKSIKCDCDNDYCYQRGKKNISATTSSVTNVFQQFGISEKLPKREQIRLVRLKLEELYEQKVGKFESRLRSLEQPVWILSLNDDRWERACEGLCTCYPKDKSILCWNAHFQAIPSDQVIPVDVRIIDLSMNKITTLHKDTLSGLTRLLEIDFFENRISYLPPNIFRNLGSLKKLKLNRNLLDKLPEILLTNLKNLEYADFSGNSIEELPEKIFRECKKLVSLFMHDNRLRKLPSTIFRTLTVLENLDLSGNQLNYLSISLFRSSGQLRRLRLDNNKIKTLPHTIFQDIKFLEILALSRNIIQTVPSEIKNLPHLRTLDLSGNKITKLNANEFNESTSVKELYLQENQIWNISRDAFTGLGMLIKLILNGNNVAELRNGIFKNLTALESLHLENNGLKLIESKVFEQLRQIKEIHLEKNMLYHIRNKTLDNLISLTAITLSNNMWDCSCHLDYFSKWVRKFKAIIQDVNSITCSAPPRLTNRLVQQITMFELCND